MRLPIVGVMGGSMDAAAGRAAELGRMLAGLGVHLLTGGGAGAMAAVSRGFADVEDRRGAIIGVLPAGCGAAYPNRWVEIPIRTHLPLSGERGEEPMSRNHINVLSSDAVVALPGGSGTLSEARLALRYGKPLVAYLENRNEIPGLPREVEALAELAQVRSWLANALGIPRSADGVSPAAPDR